MRAELAPKRVSRWNWELGLARGSCERTWWFFPHCIFPRTWQERQSSKNHLAFGFDRRRRQFLFPSARCDTIFSFGETHTLGVPNYKTWTSSSLIFISTSSHLTEELQGKWGWGGVGEKTWNFQTDDTFIPELQLYNIIVSFDLHVYFGMFITTVNHGEGLPKVCHVAFWSTAWKINTTVVRGTTFPSAKKKKEKENVSALANLRTWGCVLSKVVIKFQHMLRNVQHSYNCSC